MKSFGDMMKTAQKMQRLMTEMNETLENELLPAESVGGGAVEAVVNGHGELRQIRIKPETLKDGDAELLEDLVLTAVKGAQAKAKVHKDAATSKITGGFALPF
jgi:DNA-binding YbaB/EbfC family protein